MDHKTPDPEQRETNGDIGYVKGDNAGHNVNKNTTYVAGDNTSVRVGEVHLHVPSGISSHSSSLTLRAIMIVAGIAVLGLLAIVILVAILSKNPDKVATPMIGTQIVPSPIAAAISQSTATPSSTRTLISAPIGLTSQPTPTPESTPFPPTPTSRAPTSTAAPTKTTVPSPTPKPALSGRITFADPNDKNKLNPVWGSSPGSSAANIVRISEDGKLTLFAGKGTRIDDGTANVVSIPMKGDFDISVRMEFDPNVSNAGGMMIASGTKFLVLERFKLDDGFVIVRPLPYNDNIRISYGNPVTYMRMEWMAPELTMRVSPNGLAWTTVLNKYVLDYGQNTVISLYVGGYLQGDRATFSEFTITPK